MANKTPKRIRNYRLQLWVGEAASFIGRRDDFPSQMMREASTIVSTVIWDLRGAHRLKPMETTRDVVSRTTFGFSLNVNNSDEGSFEKMKIDLHVAKHFPATFSPSTAMAFLLWEKWTWKEDESAACVVETWFIPFSSRTTICLSGWWHRKLLSDQLQRAKQSVTKISREAAWISGSANLVLCD
jgi:hypothetical protein